MAKLSIPLLLLFAPFVFPLDCFSSLNFPDTRPCNTVQGRDHKEGIADIFLNVVDIGINIVQTLTNSQFIDDIAKNVFQTTNINIRSRELNRPWVRTVLGLLNFGDISHHCWITYRRSTGETTDRGCGTEGAVEQFGSKFAAWLQGDPLHVLAGGDICFAPPFGNGDEEMCLCKTDACNENSSTAKASLGIHQKAESIMCGDKDCPVMDLSKVIGEDWKGFNTACYKKDNQVGSDSEEHCFSTEGIYDEEAVKAARLTAKADSVIGARFGAFTFTSQSETPLTPACASECLDPNGSGQWCCEACEGKTCSGGTATSRAGAGSSLDSESSTANAQKGKLGFWLLFLCSCVISVALRGF